MSRVTRCADCGAPMVNTSNRYCADCLSVRLAPTEAETVASIVAWLRGIDVAHAYSHPEDIADAIERGDWKANGGRDG